MWGQDGEPGLARGPLNQGPTCSCGSPGLAMLVLALLLVHTSAQSIRLGNVNETFCSTGDMQDKSSTNCTFAQESTVNIVAYGNGLDGCKFVVTNLGNPHSLWHREWHRECCYMESFRNFEEDPYLCDRSQQPSGCRAKEDASVTEIKLGIENTSCNLLLKNFVEGDVGSYTAVFPKDEKTNKWINLNVASNEKAEKQTSLILAIVLSILLCIAVAVSLVWWKRILIFSREAPGIYNLLCNLYVFLTFTFLFKPFLFMLVDPEGKQDEPSHDDQSRDEDKNTLLEQSKPKQEQRSFAQIMTDSSTRVDNIEGLTIYQPERVQTLKGDIEKYEFNLSDQLKDYEKTLLLIGAKGVGKSSFSNSLANYVFGVQSGDYFRFKIDGKRVRKVTAYTLNESKLPYKLTIVDTPGLEGDGQMKDRRTVLLKDIST